MLSAIKKKLLMLSMKDYFKIKKREEEKKRREKNHYAQCNFFGKYFQSIII